MRMQSARRALTLALALILTGCAATGSGVTETRAALCDQFRPIRWSLSDTAETAAQAKAHNAVGVALCRWKP